MSSLYLKIMDRTWLTLLFLIGKVIAHVQYNNFGGFRISIPSKLQKSNFQPASDTSRLDLKNDDTHYVWDHEQWWIPATQQQPQNSWIEMKASPLIDTQPPNILFNEQQFQSDKPPVLAAFRMENRNWTHEKSFPQQEQQVDGSKHNRQDGNGWNEQGKDWQNQKVQQELGRNQLQSNELQRQKSWGQISNSAHDFIIQNQYVANGQRQQSPNWPDTQHHSSKFSNQLGNDAQHQDSWNQKKSNSLKNQGFWEEQDLGRKISNQDMWSQPPDKPQQQNIKNQQQSSNHQMTNWNIVDQVTPSHLNSWQSVKVQNSDTAWQDQHQPSNPEEAFNSDLSSQSDVKLAVSKYVEPLYEDSISSPFKHNIKYNPNK